MIVVVQRVSQASVTIERRIKSKIGKGLLLLVGIGETDGREDLEWLAKKIVNMRVFGDEGGKMNLSSIDVNGELLVVSQFTLHAMTKKGNRPSYIKAARPEVAMPLYEDFVRELGKYGSSVKTGEFGADMKVALVNDGPVTILMDSKNKM